MHISHYLLQFLLIYYSLMEYEQTNKHTGYMNELALRALWFDILAVHLLNFK